MTQAITAYNPQESRDSAHALSFNELIKELWRGRLILLICVFTAVLLGLGLVAAATPQYTAEIKIAPAQSNFSLTGTSTAQSFVSIFGGTQQYTDYAHFLDLMHSVRLASVLEARYGIMKDIFPYDETKKEFVPDPDLVPSLMRWFRGMLGLPTFRPPTAPDLARYLEDAVEIDRRTDSTTILTYRHKDAAEARVFLQRVYDESDKLLRAERLQALTAMRDYISQRLVDAATIEQRAVLIQLWGTEETQLLLLGSGDPVGARVIDDPSVSNLPTTGATRVLLIAALAGLALALIIVIIRAALRRA